MKVVLKIISVVQWTLYSIYSSCARRTFHSCPSSVRLEKLGYLHGAKYISIGEESSIQRGCYLTAWDEYEGQHFNPQIVIGDGVNIGAYNHITAIKKITIGDGCLTGKLVTITDNSHGCLNSFDELTIPPSVRPLHSKGEVVIEKNVWICDKATILPGVTIGEGTIVAANSVVTHNVPPFSVVAGCPAKVVRNLN